VLARSQTEAATIDSTLIMRSQLSTLAIFAWGGAPDDSGKNHPQNPKYKNHNARPVHRFAVHHGEKAENHDHPAKKLDHAHEAEKQKNIPTIV
jgi:hypothetical protein